MTFDHDVHVKSSEKLEKHGKLHGLKRGPSFFTVFFRTPSLKKEIRKYEISYSKFIFPET